MLLACGVCIEWPPECAKFIAVDLLEELFTLLIVKDFPAHQGLIIANGCHSEDLFAIPLELNGFFYFNLSIDGQSSVAEVFCVFERGRSKLDVAFFLVSLTEKHGLILSMEALNSLALKIWYLSVVELQNWLIIVDIQHVHVVGGLHSRLTSIARKHGCCLLPKVGLVI